MVTRLSEGPAVVPSCPTRSSVILRLSTNRPAGAPLPAGVDRHTPQAAQPEHLWSAGVLARTLRRITARRMQLGASPLKG